MFLSRSTIKSVGLLFLGREAGNREKDSERVFSGEIRRGWVKVYARVLPTHVTRVSDKRQLGITRSEQPVVTVYINPFL